MKLIAHSAVSLRSALLLLLFALVSCRNGGLLPRSGGQLYGVLLVGDTAGMVRSVLSADVEGLPQPEPSFDVSEVSTLVPPSAASAMCGHSLKPWCISGHRRQWHFATVSTA